MTENMYLPKIYLSHKKNKEFKN